MYHNSELTCNFWKKGADLTIKPMPALSTLPRTFLGLNEAELKTLQESCESQGVSFYGNLAGIALGCGTRDVKYQDVKEVKSLFYGWLIAPPHCISREFLRKRLQQAAALIPTEKLSRGSSLYYAALTDKRPMSHYMTQLSEAEKGRLALAVDAEWPPAHEFHEEAKEISYFTFSGLQEGRATRIAHDGSQIVGLAPARQKAEKKESALAWRTYAVTGEPLFFGKSMKFIRNGISLFGDESFRRDLCVSTGMSMDKLDEAYSSFRERYKAWKESRDALKTLKPD